MGAHGATPKIEHGILEVCDTEGREQIIVAGSELPFSLSWECR